MRYTVRCDLKYLNLLNNFHIKNLKIADGCIIFDINDLNYLNDIEIIDYIDNKKNKLKSFFKYNLFTLIGLIIFCLFFYMMSKTITEVKFSSEENYSEDVYESVNSYLTKVMNFAFLDKDIVTINKELRSKYYMYQWISVKKEGSILVIDIVDDKDIINDEEKVVTGSLYSKYDTVVEGYYIYKGTGLVKLNRSVKKGDLLISGYIKHYDGSLEETQAKGYVIGTVVEEVKVNIDKEIINTIRSGKSEEKYIFVFNNNSINNPISKYESYETEYKMVLNLGFFKIMKVVYYELIDEVIKRTQEEAEKLAEENLINDFVVSKKYDFEKILEKRILSKKESDNDYEFVFFVKKKVDITEFGKLEKKEG